MVENWFKCIPFILAPAPGNTVFPQNGGTRAFQRGDNEAIHLKSLGYSAMRSFGDITCAMTIDPRVTLEVDIKDLSYNNYVTTPPYCIKWKPEGVETCANNTYAFPRFTLTYSTLMSLTVTPNVTFEGRFWIVVKGKPPRILPSATNCTNYSGTLLYRPHWNIWKVVYQDRWFVIQLNCMKGSTGQ